MMMIQRTALLALIVALAFPTAVVVVDAADYGVDCSFPIHNADFSCGDLLGDRKAIYDDYMAGCRRFYGKKAHRCTSNEADRIEMSRRQPQSMVNYTDTGFKKIKAPKELFDLLKNHWETNKDDAIVENWPSGNVYVNHWEKPTHMVSVEDTNLRGGGPQLKRKVWEAAKPTIEAWTGMELQPTSQYGIRVYHEGAILSPHVDRLPLVSSCIINVAQDVDEDWVLEVYDRHDRAVNVTMGPGDMVLYESGSLMHGRPFAMKGRFYANVFIHFEPTGRPLGDTKNEYLETLDDFYPPYLQKESPEAANWARANPHGWGRPVPSAPLPQYRKSPAAHTAAAQGDLEGLKEAIKKEGPSSVAHADHNGWRVIHEAVRYGDVKAVRMLIEDYGADKNARTNSGISPLNLAVAFHSKAHPVSQYLLKIGAEDTGPEQEL